MIEHKIRAALHNDAAKVQLPGDLLDRIKRDALRPSSRRGSSSRVANIAWKAAVATGILMAVALLPPIQSRVKAAIEWVMVQKVTHREATPAEVKEAAAAAQVAPLVNPQTLDVDEVREIPYQELPGGGYVLHQVIRVTTVGTLLSEDPAWPLPAYLPPDPTDRVTTHHSYLKDGRLAYVTLRMTYQVELQGEKKTIEVELQRNGAPIPQEVVERLARGEFPAVYAPGVEPRTFTTKQVTVRGERTVARGDSEGFWILEWWATTGGGLLRADLPLDQLVKVAESLPAMR